MTDEMLELRKAKRTNYNEDWKLARRLRNDCVSTVRKAKPDFIQN